MLQGLCSDEQQPKLPAICLKQYLCPRSCPLCKIVQTVCGKHFLQTAHYVRMMEVSWVSYLYFCPLGSSHTSTSQVALFSSALYRPPNWLISLPIRAFLIGGSTVEAYTCAVTLGLPSLSPPIQDPKVRGVVPVGSSLPVCFFSAALSLRM